MITEADFFNAMADETRRRILALLSAHGELCVCELHVALDIQQPKVSRHLSVLRDLDILSMRRAGTWIFYRLNPQLPTWCSSVLTLMKPVWNGNSLCQEDTARLLFMENRPMRCCA